mmetsp:Transcript_53364/g.147380  ORF Transcript_53364/g.147380 Transcript_53364/m.147380 type:complete len:423 (-) Transcript_53364:80-1348(-)
MATRRRPTVRRATPCDTPGSPRTAHCTHSHTHRTQRQSRIPTATLFAPQEESPSTATRNTAHSASKVPTLSNAPRSALSHVNEVRPRLPEPHATPPYMACTPTQAVAAAGTQTMAGRGLVTLVAVVQRTQTCGRAPEKSWLPAGWAPPPTVGGRHIAPPPPPQHRTTTAATAPPPHARHHASLRPHGQLAPAPRENTPRAAAQRAHAPRRTFHAPPVPLRRARAPPGAWVATIGVATRPVRVRPTASSSPVSRSALGHAEVRHAVKPSRVPPSRASPSRVPQSRDVGPAVTWSRVAPAAVGTRVAFTAAPPARGVPGGGRWRGRWSGRWSGRYGQRASRARPFLSVPWSPLSERRPCFSAISSSSAWSMSPCRSMASYPPPIVRMHELRSQERQPSPMKRRQTDEMQARPTPVQRMSAASPR